MSRRERVRCILELTFLCAVAWFAAIGIVDTVLGRTFL